VEEADVINKPFNQPISHADIDWLIANEVKEGRTLEYKQQLPGNADKDRKEFLADVSSFANAAGGDLVYGVIEKRDAGNTTGIPESILGLRIKADLETRRLDSMIQAGIAPRIAGIRIQVVDGFTDGPVLVLRIPKSYAAPHMVSFQEHFKFYSRNNGGKYALDVVELRAAFALSESQPERVRRFRDERLARIVAGETPLHLKEAPKVVLHILPVSALTSGSYIDIHRLHDDYKGLRLPCFTPGAPFQFRYNLDGLLSWDSQSEREPHFAYAQAFRNGAVEYVDTWTLGGDLQGVLPANRIEESLIRGLRDYLRIMSGLDILPPLVVMASLLGVRGYRIVQNKPLATCPPIDRDDLLLPDVMIEEMGDEADRLLRPAFDALWQAAGWRESANYNEQGKWVER
jgi:hypothetical protein